MKSNASTMPSKAALDVLRHEFDVLQKLDGRGVPHVLGLEEDQGRVVLILEDSAHERLSSPCHDLQEFLSVAVGIVRALEHVHLQGFLHLDIKPSNIIYHQDTASVQLIDFGSSTLAHKADQVFLAGTMGYMPPEQIGRTAHTVDERSDLYALGMTFYELLSGSLPFDAEDETGWVTCHLSMNPPSLGERVEGLPASIVALVHRLIRKDPAMRYQSASGVLYDLCHAMQQLTQLGDVPDFELGSHDYDASLSTEPLPLYERAKLARHLTQLWDQDSSAICLHGVSGTGKLDLVQHVLDAHRGEPLRWLLTTCEPNVVAIERLLMRWVDDVLLDSAREEIWRARFAELPASYRDTASERVPAFKRLWDASHSEHTTPEEICEVWTRIMALVMRQERRLLVIEHASLLDAVSHDVWTKLIVGQQLGRAHLVLLHDSAQKPVAVLDVPDLMCLQIPALSRSSVGDALEHMLCGPVPSTDVASHIYAQVGGHVRRIRQMLSALISHKALRQHRTTGRWMWHAEALEEVQWPEALVEMITWDIASTSPGARRVLEVLVSGTRAPCDATLMSSMLDISLEEAGALVDEAVMARHVRRDDEGLLTLCEPRVGAIILDLMSEEARVATHLGWADVCRARASLDDPRSCQQLFMHERHVWHTLETSALHDTLSRMVCAAEAWVDEDEHERAVEVIVCALEITTRLDPHDRGVQEHRSRLLARQAECCYYMGDVVRALELCEQVRQHDFGEMERARFALIEALILAQQGRYEACLDVALESLERLGLTLPRGEEALQAAVGEALGVMHAHLERVPPEALHELPPARDARHLMIFELLVRVAPAAFQTSASLFALIELTLLDLSVQWGLVAQTAQCLGPCGMIAHSVLGDHDLAVRLGEAAIKVGERFSPHPSEAVAWFVNGACLFHLRYTPARVLEVLDHAHELCVRFEDHEHGAYAAHHQIMTRRLTGHLLEEVHAQFVSSREYCERVGSISNLNVISYYDTSVSVLRGTCRMSDALERIARLRAEHLERAGMEDTNTCVSHVETAYAAYWSDDIDLAWQALCSARALLPFIQGLITEYHVLIYSALIAAARLEHTSGECEQARELLEQTWTRLARVAHDNPEMYGAIFELVSAERARSRGDSLDVVVSHYSDCARLAGSRFIQWRARAAERQAQLWQTHRQKRLVHVFVQEAHELYREWGALKRCRLLERDYREFTRELRQTSPSKGTAHNDSRSIQQSTQTHTLHDIIDMQSVFRANQAITEAMRSDRLYETLLETMMEHAGAEQGSLILCHDGAFTVVASLPHDAPGAFTIQPLHEADQLAHEIIMYCAQHRRHVLLNDASHDPKFGGNPSIKARQVQSLLCQPIVERGELLGVLYLENNLMSHAFSAQHLRVLGLLAGQAAVSLQNTLMFQNLEHQVQARTRQLDDQHREIRTLLDHLPHGVITLDAQMCIEPRYSAHTAVIMGDQVFVGKSLEQTLFAWTDVGEESLSKMRAVLDFSFGMPEFMARMNWDHLPTKITRQMPDHPAQHLVIEWSPITDDQGDVHRIMLTVRDETKLLVLEQSAREHARELEIINHLLSAGLRDFQEFSFNARQRLNENHLMGDEDNLHDDEILALLFRNFHTIKGNARLLGLELLSHAAHTSEAPIAELRAIPAVDRDWSVIEPAAEEIEHALHRFIDVLQEYERVLADNFGELLQENHAIDSHVVARLREEVARALANPDSAMDAMSTMHILLSNAEAVSLEHIVKKTSRIFDGLAEELGKPVPRVELSGSGVWMSFGFGSVLHDVMIHLFRNAFDHGIEHPAQRREAGKPEHGTVRIHSESHEAGARIELWDDGAGLALPRLRDMAQDDTLSDDEAAALIFEPGRTTAAELTQISGRGVGMDAVRSFLLKQGCTIELVWRADAPDARGHRAFALRVEIPAGQLIRMH